GEAVEELLARALEVRKAELREGHAARVEPAVDHLGNAPHRPLAALAGEGDLVDPRLVDDEVLVEARVGLLRRVKMGEGLRVSGLDRGDAGGRHLGLTLLADPDVERRAPEALAAQRPV